MKKGENVSVMLDYWLTFHKKKVYWMAKKRTNFFTNRKVIP